MTQRSRTAALLIDFQEAFIGRSSPFNLEGSDALIANARSLVRSLRERRIPIVWTRVYLDDWSNSPYSRLWPQHFGSDGEAVFLRRGSPSHEIVPGLLHLVESDDLVIDKPRYSAFVGTSLEATLQRMNVSELLFAGVTTNVCVESTLRDAFQLDFRCRLVRECTLTFDRELQECSERVISMVFGEVVSLHQLFASAPSELEYAPEAVEA